MLRFELDSIEPIFAGHVFGVQRHHLLADGEAFSREVVTHPGAVAVVAITDDGSVLLLAQFRAPVGDRIFEIPAGTLDIAGEPATDAARRELLEETGYESKLVRSLGSFFNSPGYCDQRTEIFLATSLEFVGATPSGVEELDMKVLCLPLSEARAMVSSGEITCAITALALELAAAQVGD
jgi:ADP-ribose pyrophosphatase